MQNKNVNGLKILSEEIESELDMYINLFIILYADDTVLLSETKEDLQIQLNMLSEYCTDWKLKVNVQKSKIVIFSKGRMPQNINFYYDGVELEIVKEFSYLGVLFSRSGNFLKAKKTQVDKALSAMYNIIRKGKYHNLSIECLLDLFDKIVKPILLYGCEVCCFGDNSIIERVHLKFCKLILNIKKSTPDCMVYGELGRYPINISIKLRIVNYWAKLVTGKPEKLPVILYFFSVVRHNHDIPWVKNVKHR